ncbi:uncharacterized protein PRCAT00005150001 [Priceomyces carsonii]|uniref:uncharacterized protein n=1 Tax=Priceomyces carsonii TaxID=28549 RepID=UPI002EDB1903|nr:unnamed protein product [Priceomyces carsonii]
MDDSNVLDPSVIKDLSNHIYEKRKATAFHIENLTKAALARNDSRTIYKIINELTILTNGGTNTGKMGAITALGSVSVALGSFAIAYFLEEIVKPIFATFRDTDARVRYYACESLYNIAKIARGEILLYFNEVFDILCILVTDTESSVKNAADILDRLIKDIVSAKSTNYVSILQQEASPSDISGHFINQEGVGIQVNNPQDAQKAFSLPKFIPTLLERMYTIDPFAKKFLISWIELFDDIPALELITFLPNFLEQLIRFLMNNAPSDVRTETKNLLNVLLKEIKSICRVKFDLKRKQLIEERSKLKLEQAPNGDSTIEANVEGLKLNNKDADDGSSVKSSSTTIIKRKDIDAKESQSYHDDGYRNGEEIENGQNIYVDYPTIISILLSFLRVKEGKGDNKIIDLSGEDHDVHLEIQLIALRWLQEMLDISPTSFVKYLPDCISILTESVALADKHKDNELRSQLLKLNLSLQQFLVNLNESGLKLEDDEEVTPNLVKGLTKEVYDEFLEFHLGQTLQVLMQECLESTDELSKITALDWFIFLYSKYPEQFFKGESDEALDFTTLLRSSIDASNDVILRVLKLLSKISESNEVFFKNFMGRLVHLFQSELVDKPEPSSLSGGKVEFIIRKLCVTLSSEKIYREFSEVLKGIEDLKFLNSMLVTLNTILLTAQELAGLRKKLKNLDSHKIEDWSLFASLFQSWSNNAPSALSLCLLTSNYELAYLIIKNLSELEVDFQLLTQLDILVQLLESPIFLKLRLQLLEPERNPYLYKTLYGLLMILPQSSTFVSLKERLSSVSYIHSINASSTGSGVSGIAGTASLPMPNNVSSGPSTPSATLSSQPFLKRKRNYEMLELFTRAQERQELYTLLKKSRELSPVGSRQLRTQPLHDKRDYFSANSLSGSEISNKDHRKD